MGGFLQLTNDLDGSPMFVRPECIDAVWSRQRRKGTSTEWSSVTCVMTSGQRDPAAVTESPEQVVAMVDAALSIDIEAETPGAVQMQGAVSEDRD